MEVITILRRFYSARQSFKGFLAVIFTSFFLILFYGCEDVVVDTSVSKSVSNDNFSLILTISNDVVRLNESIRVDTELKRIVHADSLGYVLMKMSLDATGGVIDGHSFSSSSSITVSMDGEVNALFNTLSFFKPSYSYSSTKDEYSNYMPMGSISATFNDLILSIPIQMVEP